MSLKDEAAGAAKKAAGKLVHDDELRDKGEEQQQKGIEIDEAKAAQRLGSRTGPGRDGASTWSASDPGPEVEREQDPAVGPGRKR